MCQDYLGRVCNSKQRDEVLADNVEFCQSTAQTLTPNRRCSTQALYSPHPKP